MDGSSWDVIVVGGGHNGLVAAAYLARAGRRVLVLERSADVGGAAVSAAVFPGVDARLSRYSYLVSLLPDRICADLGLDLTLASRSVASYTPDPGAPTEPGLLVERTEGAPTRASFRALTGSEAEYDAWRTFYADLADIATAVAPSLLEPLRTADALRPARASAAAAWEALTHQPLGDIVTRTFGHDLVRGVVLTDGLIGIHASAYDPSLLTNRCFLYHVVGNGDGQWRVPVGGMGAVTAALAEAARRAGAVIRTRSTVTDVLAGIGSVEVGYADDDGGEHTVTGGQVLANVAPAVLDRLRGRVPESVPEGSQLKINMVLSRLPALRSGVDPAVAFAGTFHVDEGFEALQTAYAQAAGGELPDPLPGEVYCHTLTDPTILSPQLRARGWHTLTLFGVHTPAGLFAGPGVKDEAVARSLAGLDRVLAEPIENCLARDADGRPCLQASTPGDIEAALAMPGGHIFHGDLQWPFAVDPDEVGGWGVATDHPRVLVCGSGARRGGGVSGIGGHNAAQAALADGAQMLSVSTSSRR